MLLRHCTAGFEKNVLATKGYGNILWGSPFAAASEAPWPLWHLFAWAAPKPQPNQPNDTYWMHILNTCSFKDHYRTDQALFNYILCDVLNWLGLQSLCSPIFASALCWDILYKLKYTNHTIKQRLSIMSKQWSCNNAHNHDFRNKLLVFACFIWLILNVVFIVHVFKFDYFKTLLNSKASIVNRSVNSLLRYTIKSSLLVDVWTIIS